MTRLFLLSLALLLANAGLVFSQPIPAGMKVELATYLQAGYNGLKNDLLEAANKMPASDYGFKPGAAAEMRSYGQLFTHVAESQFGTCAPVRGIANPSEGRNLEHDLTTKAQIIK